MIIADYNPRRAKEVGYDKILEDKTEVVRKKLVTANLDWFEMVIGQTGSGKSNLTMHIQDRYLGDKSDIKYIGLNQEAYAYAMKITSEEKHPRFCVNDEANISKRSALTKYNRDLLDLFFSIRGVNIYSIWCNPSLDMIDKPFIIDLVKGIYYIATIDENRPRIYYYFRKQDILHILNKYGNLTIPLLKKVGSKHAFYMGWFCKYKGHLTEAYDNIKDVRMSDKIEEHFEKYGGKSEMLTVTEICKQLHISRMTLLKYEEILIERGIIKEGVEVIRSATNRRHFNKSVVPLFIDLAKELNVQFKKNGS